MQTLSIRLAVASLLGVAACAGNTFIPEPQRVQLQDELAGHARYLKVACYVTPFFHDDGKLLLTDQSPDELDLIDRPNGEPVLPGPPMKILPPGTKLRIDRVSFPTALEVAERIPLTPKYYPWVLLYAPDDFGSASKPYVLVLRPDMRSHDEFVQELNRYLGDENPTPLLKSFPPAVQSAIAQKTVSVNMSTRQVEMAWGYPARIHLDGQTHAQVWSWPQDKQRAWFSADALTNWMDHGQGGGNGPQ
jgi:hypothetical protein